MKMKIQRLFSVSTRFDLLRLRLLLTIPLVALLLSSCSKDEDPDFSNRGVFDAKVNGENWKPDQVISRESFDRLQIEGYRSSDKSQLAFTISPSDVGIYSLQDGEVSMQFIPSEADKPEEYKDAGYYTDRMIEGEINITKYTQDSIKFTFNGVGEYFEITEGEMAIKIN